MKKSLLSPQELNNLERSHAMYSSYNQEEHDTDKRMAALQHPKARPYVRLRAFFDSLLYACNAGARRVSYGGQAEQSEYWAPDLEVSWNPTGSLAKWGHIYPAHEGWSAYIEEAAQAGWKGAAPEINAGAWHIYTMMPELVADLHRLRDAGIFDTYAFTSELRDGATHITIYLHGRHAAHARVLAVVRKHHRAIMLPRRTPEDDAADRAPLPLANRQFTLSGVARVTVTPRLVLVPLIPAGDAEFATQVLNDLLALCGRGYPFKHIDDWVKRETSPATYREIRKQFASKRSAA